MQVLVLHKKKGKKEGKKEGKWHAAFHCFMEHQSGCMKQIVGQINLNIWGQISAKGHWYLNCS